MAVAAPLIDDQFAELSRPLRPELRRRRRRRTRLLSNARLFGLCLLPLAALLIYVALTAGLTAQTYALGVQQQQRAQLVEKTNALRSQVAQLESVDRLQAVARQLHMSEPAKVAVIILPAARPPERRTAFMDRLMHMTRWLSAR